MSTDSRPTWLPAVVLLLSLAAAAFVFAGMTGEQNGNAIAGVAAVGMRSGVLAVLWWMAAAGLGLALTRFALPPTVRAITGVAAGGSASDARTSIDDFAIALGLGAALLLALDAWLGSLGLLVAARGALSWGLVLAGMGAGVFILRDAPLALARPGEGAADANASLIGWLAIGVAAALLLVAASVAPGWLWSSEFKGFDALSYHLELPKEWLLTGGRVSPVDGVVYSALPSFVESAFLHLMVMRGEPIDGAYACQWWSAIATLATALVAARIAARTIGATAAMPCAIVFLATPWTTVVGSLAYNDMLPCLGLATGWLLLLRALEEDGARLDWRSAAALALVAAAAFGAKPSALILAALPLLTLTIIHAGPRALRLAPLVLGVALVVLAPWLVRNQLAYGSPFFPFLSGVFGSGPWSEDQLAVFLAGHGPTGGIGERLGLVWQQWAGYGWGESPSPTEPWFPLWGALPLAGIAGLVALGAASSNDPRARRHGIGALAAIGVMLAGWLLATHIKSRFMLPSAIPLAIGAAWLLVALGSRLGRAPATGIAALALVLPVTAFEREPVQLTPDGERTGSAPAFLVDGTELVLGRRLAELLPTLTPEQQRAQFAQANSAYWINFMVPPDARIVAIGYSTPFYLTRPIAWSTVWDRGAFDRVVDASPGTPTAWPDRLRAEGFTHVLIDPTMLGVWDRSGWLQPALRSRPGERSWLQAFIEACPGRIRAGDGCLILALHGGPTGAAPTNGVPSAIVPAMPADGGAAMPPASGAGPNSPAGSGSPAAPDSPAPGSSAPGGG